MDAEPTIIFCPECNVRQQYYPPGRLAPERHCLACGAVVARWVSAPPPATPPEET